MKQRIRAHIEQIEIDEKPLELKGQPLAELEFSAIDTGGGFQDPILDFTFVIEPTERPWTSDEEHTIWLSLYDPSDRENKLEITYAGQLQQGSGNKAEAMGRLKDDKVGRDVVKFVMRCVR